MPAVSMGLSNVGTSSYTTALRLTLLIEYPRHLWNAQETEDGPDAPTAAYEVDEHGALSVRITSTVACLLDQSTTIHPIMDSFGNIGHHLETPSITVTDSTG